jgi:hypothetical protein
MMTNELQFDKKLMNKRLDLTYDVRLFYKKSYFIYNIDIDIFFLNPSFRKINSNKIKKVEKNKWMRNRML